MHVSTRSKLKTELIQMQLAWPKCISKVFFMFKFPGWEIFVCPGVGIGTSCKKQKFPWCAFRSGWVSVGMVTAEIELRISMLFSDERFCRHVLPKLCNN